MSINLISLVGQYLTPDMIAKIASALGMDQSLVGRAITAAVPGLLGGLTGVASTEQGSRKLFDAVSQQPPGVLDNLAGLIGGAGQKTLVENGANLLSSLMGGAGSSALSAAVGKFAGLGAGPSSSLLGLLVPVVMGTLRKQTAASGLDAGGLAQLLTSQKSEIAKALPPGFSDLLGGAGVLDNVGPAFSGAAQTAKASVQSAATSYRAAPPVPPKRSWMTWLIPIIVLAVLAWWFLGRSPNNVVEQAKTTPTQTAQGMPDQARQAAGQAMDAAKGLTVGSVDVGKSVQTTIDSLRQSLQGVTDATAAKAALPKLQDEAAQFDKIDALVNQLPASGRTALAAMIAAARPSLEELFSKVLAIPGVADVVKPTIDTIRAKLDAYAKTTG